MIVIDASAAVTMFLNLEPGAARIRERLGRDGEDLRVPHLFDVEVLHALRRHALRGQLSEEQSRSIFRAFGNMRAIRYPHTALLPRIWELRDNVTTYDAAYVALAETLEAPLVTTDARLARASGIRAEVEVFGQE